MFSPHCHYRISSSSSSCCLYSSPRILKTIKKNPNRCLQRTLLHASSGTQGPPAVEITKWLKYNLGFLKTSENPCFTQKSEHNTIPSKEYHQIVMEKDPSTSCCSLIGQLGLTLVRLSEICFVRRNEGVSI